jgi:hypothetical protein
VGAFPIQNALRYIIAKVCVCVCEYIYIYTVSDGNQDACENYANDDQDHWIWIQRLRREVCNFTHTRPPVPIWSTSFGNNPPPRRHAHPVRLDERPLTATPGRRHHPPLSPLLPVSPPRSLRLIRGECCETDEANVHIGRRWPDHLLSSTDWIRVLFPVAPYRLPQFPLAPAKSSVGHVQTAGQRNRRRGAPACVGEFHQIRNDGAGALRLGPARLLVLLFLPICRWPFFFLGVSIVGCCSWEMTGRSESWFLIFNSCGIRCLWHPRS